jgi:hypothetical protein
MGTMQINPSPIKGQHHQLLPNGKILFWNDVTAYIAEPDIFGDYSNLQYRRIADMPYSHLYGAVTVANDGKIWIHAGEFGTSALGRTSIFNPETETWTGINSALSAHDPTVLADDGRMYTESSILPSNATSPSQATLHSLGLSTAESPLVMTPDGRFALVGRTNIIMVAPDYSASFVSAGSFAGSNTATTNDLTSALNGMALNWRKNSGNNFRSAETVNYEIGPAIYMPKIGKIVILSGSGDLYTYDHTTNTLARPFFFPLENTGDAAQQIHQVGSIPASLNGVSVASLLTANSLSFTWTGTRRTAQEFIQLCQFIPDVRYISLLTENATAACQFFFTTPSYNATTNVVTLSGFQLTSIGLTNHTFRTGDAIYHGRPNVTFQDAPCAIIPNGDLITLGGVESTAGGGNFNKSTRLMKWDGTNAPTFLTTEFNATAGFNVEQFASNMSVLPDGSVYFVHNGCRYVPDSSENTPLTGSRPTVTYLPATVERGETVTLAGTQLNGLHEGGAYGDDSSCRSNFPIVRFIDTSTGQVRYARSLNYTYRGIQPNRTSSCLVKVPENIPNGNYNVEVVANGIPSTARTVTVKSSPFGDGTIFMNSYR